MECSAICGSFLSEGLNVGHWGKSLQRTWLPLSMVVPVKNTRLQVQAAVKPAKVGRRARRDENVQGEFYVDKACINCDTCRWMTPDVFTEMGGKSAVHHQPNSEEERLKALQALLACPTSSIHTANPPKDIIEAQKSFPLVTDSQLPEIYHCGYHSLKSYGATAYLITRPEGNILVDSPRYSEQLAKRLEDLGGVRYMFLTHIDDVADHKQWQARFNLQRIIHEDEVTPDTKDVEVKLKGEGNWTLLGPNIDLIFTPGHTKGHVALLLKDKGVLFTGDHCWATANDALVLGLYNKHSFSQQIDSLEALIHYDFTWVLPGHGRRQQFQSVQEKNDVISAVVSRERSLL